MSITNPPTGASGPGSVGLGVVRGLKRSVQATFEGEFLLSLFTITTIIISFHIYVLFVCYISESRLSVIPCYPVIYSHTYTHSLSPRNRLQYPYPYGLWICPFLHVLHIPTPPRQLRLVLPYLAFLSDFDLLCFLSRLRILVPAWGKKINLRCRVLDKQRLLSELNSNSTYLHHSSHQFFFWSQRHHFNFLPASSFPFGLLDVLA
jgi:hypothetical protein